MPERRAEAPPATLPDLLRRAAEGGHGGLRFVDRHEQERFYPWPEVQRRAVAVAAGLQALGVAPGERVALLYPTGPEFFDAFFGALLAGAVPTPLYPPLRLTPLPAYRQRTAALIAAVGAALVLTSPVVGRLLGAATTGWALRHGCRTLEELPAVEPAAWRPPRLGAEDLALVQFSSGSTREPRPVALEHRALLAQARLLNGFWPDGDGVTHRGVSWLPLYHDMGLLGCVLPALERPGELTLLAPETFAARPALWLRAISRYRATVSAAPDFGYSHCLARVRDEQLAGVDLSCWRHALNGAEAVSAETLRGFAERFGRWGLRREALTPVYGLAEAALAVTFGALDQPFASARFDRTVLARRGEARPAAQGRELVSLGRPLPGFELAVRGPRGERLPAGRVGRLWVKGPSLMREYLGQPAATAEVLHDGWLDTGDLGFLRAGELYLLGRARDLVVLRGRNHAPEEIEEAVRGLPGVLAPLAASYHPEGASGERLVLLVEVAAPGAQLAMRCRQAVLATLGLAAEEIVLLPPGALPRTSSGKLRRSEALRRHLAGELEAAAGPAVEERR
jgi:fatty-acyl-CoA synthase